MKKQLHSQTAATFAAAAAGRTIAGNTKSFMADNSGTDALLFKDDPEYWFEISVCSARPDTEALYSEK